MIEQVLKHITRFKSHPSVRFLDAIYGPQAKPLRANCAAMLLDRKITASSKEAQYGNLRKMLLEKLNIVGTCKADEDSQFEAKANEILGITKPKLKRKKTFTGTVAVCCHRVSFCYNDVIGDRLPKDLRDQLTEEAEERARFQITEGYCCGELNCLYKGDHEIRGTWEIKNG